MLKPKHGTIFKYNVRFIFEGPKPRLSEISKKMTEICTLPVLVLGADPDEHLAYSAELAFECLPNVKLNINTSNQIPVHALTEESIQDAEAENIGLKDKEIDWSKSIRLSAMKTESILLWTTILALESLGGVRQHTRKEKFQDYNLQISEAKLLKLHRKTVIWEWIYRFIFFIIILPIMLVLWPWVWIWNEVTTIFRREQ